jgi:hypothetical protein
MADPSGCTQQRHMSDTLQLKAIWVGAAAIALAIAAALLAAYAVIHLGSDGASAPRLAAHVGNPPPIEGGIVLQAHPAQDIRAFADEKKQVLDRYEWIDRDHTIARIPIDRAMALLAGGAAERKR